MEIFDSEFFARGNNLEWNNYVIEVHFGLSENVDAKYRHIVFPLESVFAAEYACLANVAGGIYSTREHLVLASTSISSQDPANHNTIRQIVQM
jgi:hypothetical protein